MKKSRLCIETEILIDEIFDEMESGQFQHECEVKYLMGYIDQKLVELQEKIEVPCLDDDEEEDDVYFD